MIDSSTPEALVRSFLVEYTIWNDASAEKSNRNEPDYMDWAHAAYLKMVGDFVLSGTELQPIAFGSQSNHLPAAEKILETNIAGDRALVKTLFSDPKFDFLQSRYEYELVQQDARWWLTQIFYVDDEGRYPGL